MSRGGSPTKRAPGGSPPVDQIVQVCLAEFEKLRDELLESVKHRQQIMLLSLGIFSVAVPVLLGKSTLDPILVCGLFFGLVILFGALMMTFATYDHWVAQVACYIYEELGPYINRRLHLTGRDQVMQWERYERELRSQALAFFLSLIGLLSVTLLLVLPAIACGILGYTKALALSVTPVWLVWMFSAAVVFFVLGLGSLIANYVFWSRHEFARRPAKMVSECDPPVAQQPCL